MKGKIFKIVCVAVEEGSSSNSTRICNDIFIGGTIRFTLDHTLQSIIKSNKGPLVPYVERYGKESFKIVLINEYTVIDPKHLKAFVQLWINRLRPAINKPAPLYLKRIRKKNGEEKANDMKMYRKAYYEANKDTLRTRQQAYRAEHPEQMLIYRKSFYEARRARLLEKLKCCCGSLVSRNNMKRHLITKLHIDRMEKM